MLSTTNRLTIPNNPVYSMMNPGAPQESTTQTVSVAYGDGIGPEIMQATLRILEAAKAGISFDPVVLGEKLYGNGISSGIDANAWESLRKHKVLLKAPIITPQGGGYKSLNVTLRKTLGLFANVRPAQSYTPFVRSFHPEMDLVIIRENEEDLYAGIEHQQTPEVVQCLKLISRPGCEKIIRYAFEYAKAHGRKKVTCMTKDNIMKQTDGLFHKVFNEIAPQYPEIASDHYIIDIGAARLATSPEMFDVIVTLNLYGDILSDISSQVSGSVGLSGSSNIGENFAMFEAIHGSAPDIAGKDLANPSGLLQAACMMLEYLGKTEAAERIHNALLKTLEDGIHTADIYHADISSKKVGTQDFATELIKRLGKQPQTLKPKKHAKSAIRIDSTLHKRNAPKLDKELVGVDVFIDWDEHDRDPEIIGQALAKLRVGNMKLKMITNRGVKVYPFGMPETFCTDHWRCRFVSRKSVLAPNGDRMMESKPISFYDILELQNALYKEGFEVIKTENLYMINNKRAYSLGQGE